MYTERRWLNSAIAASAEPQAALPWQRGARRRPKTMQADVLSAAIAKARMPAPTAKPAAIAAR